MTAKKLLAELKALGSESGRKTYLRHGAAGEVWGVRYADLGKIKKRIKIDQDVAMELWDSGVHDARVLATMIADPDAMKASTLDHWVKTVCSPFMACAVAGLAVTTPHAVRCKKKWISAKAEWVCSAGWDVLAGLAAMEDAISDAELERHLETIESDIHDARNRVRYSMNTALIAVGAYRPALEKKAIAAAKRIGKVEVDHGDTSCKTLDAAPYIKKAAAHEKKKRAKQRAKARAR